MPQIDTPLLLDILLGLVILLFVPFGIRRGVAKEALVSASIFLGASLADRFAPSWGAELSRRAAIAPDAAAFAVATAFLFGAVIFLGYGGGAALGPSRIGVPSRLVGGILAAFNAALMLSFLLRWIDAYLRQGSVLADGIVSSALRQQSDVLLLAATGVLLVLTVTAWFANALRARRQPRDVYGASAAGIPARQRPVRVASDADAGKFEPDLQQAPRSGRFGRAADATVPISSASYAAQTSWASDGSALRASNGRHRDHDVEGGQPFPAAASPADDTVWAAWNASGATEPPGRVETSNQWPVASSVGVTDDERCAVCHARVGPRDVFCPECGATL